MSSDDCRIIDDRDDRHDDRDRDENRNDAMGKKKWIDLEPADDLAAIAAQLPLHLQVRSSFCDRFIISRRIRTLSIPWLVSHTRRGTGSCGANAHDCRSGSTKHNFSSNWRSSECD